MFRHTLLCATLAAWAAAVPARASDALEELSLEELLEVEVVTASRTEQKLGELPTSVTVITRQEIEDSGARSVPDLLRGYAGLEVLATTSSSFDLSARGTFRFLSNTMLVLVDGRALNDEVYGNLLWNRLPVGLDEIASIEVIRGPGSAVYGANAFAGIVNIRTLSPQETVGVTSRLTAGSEIRDATLRYGGRRTNTAWRLIAGVDRDERAVPDATGEDAAGRSLRANATWVRDDGGSSTRLAAGLVSARTEIIPDPRAGATTVQGLTGYAHASTRRGPWRFGAYVNASTADWAASPGQLQGSVEGVRAVLTDAEVQRQARLGRAHTLVVGANLRSTFVSAAGQPSQDVLGLAAFALDEWHVGDHWILSAGIRTDVDPRVGVQASPRGSVVFRPWAGQLLSASGGRAYRNPTYVETKTRFRMDLDGFTELELHGNEDLEPERLTTYEIGWKSLWAQWCITTLTAYTAIDDGLVETEVVAFQPSPPAPFPGIPSELTYVNGEGLRIHGLETELELRFHSRFGARVAWSAVRSEHRASGERAHHVPTHRVAVTTRWMPRDGWMAHARVLYTGAMDWSEDLLPDAPMTGDTVGLDLHLRRDLGDVRVFGGLRNALDADLQDHPLSWREPRNLYLGLEAGL